MCGKLSSKTESAVNWCYILAVAEKTQGRKVHESGKDQEKFPGLFNLTGRITFHVA